MHYSTVMAEAIKGTEGVGSLSHPSPMNNGLVLKSKILSGLREPTPRKFLNAYAHKLVNFQISKSYAIVGRRVRSIIGNTVGNYRCSCKFAKHPSTNRNDNSVL